MRILVSIFVFLFITSFAKDNYELKLYEKVLPIVFQSKPLLVYADNESKKIIQTSRIFKVTQNCNEAIFLMGKGFDNLNNNCKEKPMFATSYRSFKSYKNSFGAFYWRKGRPQIKFNSDVIKEYKLYLPNSLKKYAN